MSVQATTWVWDQRRWTGNVLLVLLAIADAANREGEGSCQGVKTIAAMVGCSRSTVFAHIKDLERDGVLVRQGKHPKYGTVMWALPIGRSVPTDEEVQLLDPEPGEAGVQELDPRPSGRTGGVRGAGPYPKELTPEEPVVELSSGVEPLRHPSRQMHHEWQPRSPFVTFLREKYPTVRLQAERDRFVNWYLSKQDTSKSWEARFEMWISTAADRQAAEKEGTDELGVPNNQKRSSNTGPLPGDPDYVDPQDLIESARAAAQRKNGADI